MIYQKIKNKINNYKNWGWEFLRRELYLKNLSEINEYDLTSIDRFITYYKIFNKEGHCNYIYKEWTMRRLNKTLCIYGVDWFKDKRILVLGDGIGFIGSFFAELGAKVLSLEGRRENVNIAKLKYRNLKNFETKEFDLNNDFTKFGKFDLIINFGFMEVMKDHFHIMDNCCQISDEMLIETIIKDDLNNDIKESSCKKVNDNSFDYKIYPPEEFDIITFMKIKRYSITQYNDQDLNCPGHSYNWKKEEKIKPYISRRRFWRFVK